MLQRIGSDNKIVSGRPIANVTSATDVINFLVSALCCCGDATGSISLVVSRSLVCVGSSSGSVASDECSGVQTASGRLRLAFRLLEALPPPTLSH